MGDHVLLIVAEDGDELVAGALNLIGGDTLFGRLWGCLPHAYFPNLHFEACYYQVIFSPHSNVEWLLNLAVELGKVETVGTKLNARNEIKAFTEVS